MHVLKEDRKESTRYRLVEYDDGKKVYPYSYGKDQPTFYEPEFHHGVCENKLGEIPTGSVDLLIDDPPYGTTNAMWDTEPDWEEMTERYGRILADDGLLVVFGKQPSLMPVYNAFTDDGFEFRYDLIWRKQNNPWSSHYKPIHIHENIFVFKRRDAKVSETTFNTNDVMRDATFTCRSCNEKQDPGSYSVTRTNDDKSSTQNDTWDESYEASGGDERYPISVLEYNSVHGSHEEYTGYAGQKPTELLRWLILGLSDRGDTILDPHAGSGSALLASIPLCRHSIGIEANAERYRESAKRVNDAYDKLTGLKHAKTESSSADVESGDKRVAADGGEQA
jgi:DNA modification methylase